MKFNKFNITIERVSYDDLELIRNWRNSEYVNRRMVSNKFITKEDQLKWFDKINNNSNYYFIGNFNNEKIGVVSISNIINNSGEGAIYLSNEKFEDSGIVARLILCFNDFVFDHLNLESICSHVKRDNIKAISSTIAQGGVIDEDKTTPEYIYFKITRSSYRNKTERIRKILTKIQ